MIEEFFQNNYSDDEKDLFTESLHRKNQLRKQRFNADSTVILVMLPDGQYCIAYMNYDEVFFKAFLDSNEANRLFDRIVELYSM